MDAVFVFGIYLLLIHNHAEHVPHTSVYKNLLSPVHGFSYACIIVPYLHIHKHSKQQNLLI